jgi:hypothetical protein
MVEDFELPAVTLGFFRGRGCFGGFALAGISESDRVLKVSSGMLAPNIV